jgi:hypothetical protein
MSCPRIVKKIYRAINGEHAIELKPSQMTIMNDEIVGFEVNGIPSPFKNTNLKVLEDAAIVTVFGYGNGETLTPDAIVGFASPKGWCNAETRSGDCTSPVLDCNGNIVGFWTHGNGVDFGRFEPVTPEFINLAKENHTTTKHVGLDFRSCPLSQQI